MKTAAADELKIAVDKFVIHEAHSDDMAESHGVAIYFPANKIDFDNDPDHTGYDESNTYMEVDFVQNSQWDNWLQEFLIPLTLSNSSLNRQGVCILES